MITKKKYILFLVGTFGSLLSAEGLPNRLIIQEIVEKRQRAAANDYQGNAMGRRQQVEIANIIATMINPLLKTEPAVAERAKNGWRGMSQDVFDGIISEIDALVGIDRNSLWAWLPSMWTKIKIVDAFKEQINFLRYGVDAARRTKDLQEAARSLRALLYDSLRIKEAQSGEVRPGLKTVALAYAYGPHVTTRGVVHVNKKS